MDAFFASAEHEIDILAHSALFLAEDADILRILADKGRAGVTVRIALGDPDCPNIAERGEEKSSGDAMPARIRNSLTLYQFATRYREHRDSSVPDRLVQLDLPRRRSTFRQPARLRNPDLSFPCLLPPRVQARRYDRRIRCELRTSLDDCHTDLGSAHGPVVASSFHAIWVSSLLLPICASAVVTVSVGLTFAPKLAAPGKRIQSAHDALRTTPLREKPVKPVTNESPSMSALPTRPIHR